MERNGWEIGWREEEARSPLLASGRFFHRGCVFSLAVQTHPGANFDWLTLIPQRLCQDLLLLSLFLCFLAVDNL